MVISYCFSRRQRKEDQPAINHLQGKDDKTLCGIVYGIEWDFDCCEEGEWYSRCIRCDRIFRNISQGGGEDDEIKLHEKSI